MKKIVIFEYLDSDVIGTREHMFDWEIGDEIISNGKKSEIINIIDESSLGIVKDIFKNFEKKVMTLDRNSYDEKLNEILRKCHFKEMTGTITVEKAEEIKNKLYEDMVEQLMAL